MHATPVPQPSHLWPTPCLLTNPESKDPRAVYLIFIELFPRLIRWITDWRYQMGIREVEQVAECGAKESSVDDRVFALIE